MGFIITRQGGKVLFVLNHGLQLFLAIFDFPTEFPIILVSLGHEC